MMHIKYDTHIFHKNLINKQVTKINIKCKETDSN